MSRSMSASEAETSFVDFFRTRGGELSDKVALASFPQMGRGLVALEALPEDTLLFSIPRSLLLGTRTSALLALAKAADEAAADQDGMEVDGEAQPLRWEGLRSGWTQLLLVMLWERFRASPQGKEALKEVDSSADWGAYFGILPSEFDTPMFWSEEELGELKGTAIVDKIGKAEASETYHTTLLPYVESHPRLFLGTLASTSSDSNKALIAQHYGEQAFHLMGSAVLSRSFHVNAPKEGEKIAGEGAEGMIGDESEGKVLVEQVGDETGESEQAGEEEDVLHIPDEESDSEDGDADEEENIDDVCMVPMADMLNARFESDNARLFYHPSTLEMRTTRAIEKGEQLWNTYGDPPNCDLLRRYGHTDEPNGADVVELPSTTLLEAVLSLESLSGSALEARRTALLARIEWWCAEGIDEIHALTYLFPPSSTPPHAPEPLAPNSSELRAAAAGVAEEVLVATRLLILDEEAFEKVRAKSKMPSPRIEAREKGAGKELGVAEVLLRATELRMAEYATSIAQDEARLYGAQAETLKQSTRSAVVVRLGEKRILADNARVLKAAHEASLKIAGAASSKPAKRKGAESTSTAASKKSKK